MIKKILVPLDPSPYSDSATDYACFIAKRQQAEVTGLVIIDIPGIEESVGPYGIGGIYWAEELESHLFKEVQNRIESLLERFQRKCTRHGVAYRQAKLQGIPSKLILEEALYFDLVITGLRSHFHFVADDKPGDSLEKILTHSITPVLAVPESFAPIHNVLVAFDASFAAGRALQRFSHLARAFDFDIKVIMADKHREKAEYHLQRVKDYLNAYHLPQVQTEWSSRDIRDLVDYFSEAWADVLVLGAHSQKSILDFGLGSITRQLIKSAKKPLFIGF